jgi:hypothetical protein
MMQLLLLQVSLHPKIFNKKFSRWEAVLIWMQNNKLIWLKLVHLRSKNNNHSVEIKPLRLICKAYNFYSFFRKICKEFSSNNLRLKINKWLHNQQRSKDSKIYQNLISVLSNYNIWVNWTKCKSNHNSQ